MNVIQDRTGTADLDSVSSRNNEKNSEGPPNSKSAVKVDGCSQSHELPLSRPLVAIVIILKNSIVYNSCIYHGSGPIHPKLKIQQFVPPAFVAKVRRVQIPQNICAGKIT